MSTVVPTSLHVFPECPTYGFNVQPQYLVKIAVQEGGFERVDRRWARPLNIFTAVPIGDRDEETIQNVLYFWHAMGGRATTFLFKDWTDYKSCPVGADITAVDQPLETVTIDDASTAYQLTKVYQAGPITQVREITQPKGDTIVVANASGVAQTDFTLDEATGVLKPGGGFTGTPHSWGGEFYVPVRFDSELDMQVVDKQIQTVSFTLREKRIKLATTFTAGAGSVWTRGADPPVLIFQLAYGEGVIAGVGNDGHIYASSDIGETWTDVESSTFMTSIAYANGQFVAAGDHVLISPDGLSWGAPIAIPGHAGFVASVAGDGSGHWVAVGGSTVGSNYAVSSDNGATWSTPGVSSVGSWFQAVYDTVGAQFVALGSQDGTGTNAIYISADNGSTWTEHLFTTDMNVFNISRSGSTWLMGFDSDEFPLDTRVAGTPLGLLTATSHQSGLGPPSDTVDDQGPYVFCAAGFFFAFGDLGGGVASSTDGIAWQLGVIDIPGGPASPGAFCYDSDTGTFVVTGGFDVFGPSKSKFESI